MNLRAHAPSSGWRLIGLIALLGITTIGASAATLDGLVREAYGHSPELRAAYARWQAALERVPQAESLPDPTVGYGYFIERMETRQLFQVEQMFPSWGKRRLRGEVARTEAEAAAEVLEAAAADLRMQVLQAAAAYVLAGQSAALMEANLALVENLTEIAGHRYRTGESSQADVLRLESEASSLRTELASWRHREPALRARINSLIGRPAVTPLPALAALPPPRAIAPDDEPRLRENLAASPDLREEQAAIRRARRSSDLARRESRPDLMFGFEYMENRDPAPDEVMAMVSINIPLWQGRYRALRREAAAVTRAARASYEARLNRLESQARMVLFETEDAARRVRLFTESLIPRARQTLTIVEADYRTGRAGFLDLQEAQRSLLDLELGLLQARTDAFVRAAEWERLAGARWGEGRDIWGVERP